MWPYFSLFIIPILMSFLSKRNGFNSVMWVIYFLALLIFVGLRHKVGMDWNNYLIMIERVSTKSLTEALRFVEPSYAFLLWLGAKSGYSIYFTNFIATFITLAGLWAFLSKTQNPWLAMVAALPILIIVVAMGANRQAPAIGILLALTAYWYQLKLPWRVLLVLLATSFHFSAFFFIVFVALNLRTSLLIKFVAGTLTVGLLAASWFLTDIGTYYNSLYISDDLEIEKSAGALMHVFLNAFFGSMLFLGSKFRKQLFPTPLLLQQGLLVIVLFFLAMLIPNAAGRMSLYLFPVSLYAASAMPALLASNTRVYVTLTMSLAFLAQSWVWLNFANSSVAHIPYGNYITTEANFRLKTEGN